MLITSAAIAALSVGFKTTFQNAFKGAESSYERISTVVHSNRGAETYGWLGQSTQFREWLGDRVIQNLATHDYTLKNKSYENTVGVDRDDIADDALGIYSPFIAQMGEDAANHPDELCYSLLKRGFTETCYDGQFFFDTDHPVTDENGVEQSVSNMQAGGGNPWFLMDTKRPLKPLIFQKRKDYDFVAMDKPDDEKVFSQKMFRYGVDARVAAGFGLWQLAFGSKDTLNAANYELARKTLIGMKGDKGRPLGVSPRLLVVGASNEAAAMEVVKKERDAAGATNIYFNTAEVLVVPWLD